MTHKMIATAVEMPAGKYYVGDPCYVVPDHRWIEWLELADPDREGLKILVADLDGHSILGIGTAHGDGCYEDTTHGHTYPVDAGLIGVTPVEIADGEQASANLCRIVEFTEPFTCEYDDGTIILGHISINTDWDGDDEDYS